MLLFEQVGRASGMRNQGRNGERNAESRAEWRVLVTNLDTMTDCFELEDIFIFVCPLYVPCSIHVPMEHRIRHHLSKIVNLGP